MAIESINEQLLRSVGVGVAIFTHADLKLQFSNEAFSEWLGPFEPDATLHNTLGEVDVEELSQAIGPDASEYSIEIRRRIARRTRIFKLSFKAANLASNTAIVLECHNVTRIRELESMLESYSGMVERNMRELQVEKEKAERLLLNLMPRSAYEEFKSLGTVTPRSFDPASIVVVEVLNVGEAVQELKPPAFISELTELFSSFDQIGEQFGCERIKTTGGTYMCASGLQSVDQNTEVTAAHAAVRFLRYLRRRNESSERIWTCRIGVGTGKVIGSVVGAQKYVYDVFGPAVGLALEATRMACEFEILINSEAGTDHLTEFELAPAERVDARDLGLIGMLDAKAIETKPV